MNKSKQIREIARILEERPELMELINNYEALPEEKQKEILPGLIRILEGERSSELMDDDAFLDLLYNPLFAFMNFMDHINQDPEKYRREHDEYMGGFRNKYSEKLHETEFEELAIMFCFGFDECARMTAAILEGKREEADHER